MESAYEKDLKENYYPNPKVFEKEKIRIIDVMHKTITYCEGQIKFYEKQIKSNENTIKYEESKLKELQ